MAATEGAPPGQASSLLSQPPLIAAAAVLLLLLALAWLATRRGARGASGRAAAGGGGAKQRDTVVLVGPSGAGKTVLLHQVRRRRARAARTHTRTHTRAACATTTTRAHARSRARPPPRARARARTHARTLREPPPTWRTTLAHLLRLCARTRPSPRVVQLMRGSAPDTVTSIKPGSLRGKPVRTAAQPGTPSVTLVDLPGHPQLKTCVRARERPSLSPAVVSCGGHER